eukprot:GFKZ01014577.1.p1 GENE.GFKZ01014577.1~~GFKZ01014577.1.p1  ORF type:complete len:2149 (+),score=314.18 GFKZ01014577.1:321-6767(+)
MATSDTDDADVPWGKYTYALEGLATRCYMEGPAPPGPPRPGAPRGRRLRFRVDLPSRCFVLSVVVKLPHAPVVMLPLLNDVLVERALNNLEFETVYDGYVQNSLHSDPKLDKDPPKEALESPTSVGDVANGRDSDTVARKKMMEVRRAGDALRITITDIEVKEDDDNAREEAVRRRASGEQPLEGGGLVTLGISVLGYVRGQTPAPNRTKILLNAASRLGRDETLADRAEVDGLLGLAFLGNRRFRQAAELLHGASELIVEVAGKDAKGGVGIEGALRWAAELNLLAAHAYFEHMPMSNDGIVRLICVADVESNEGNDRDVGEMTHDFLDLRTELLRMLETLLSVLVKFLAESNSPAVKMASARTIEFISEQVGCAIATHMQGILNQVLRLYPSCTEFGPRERAAAVSFSYDSMEDCFERLIDICCRLFPLTEHGVLQKLFDSTLIPVFLNGFDESDYLHFDVDPEEVADELLSTAVAQSLRVIYLVLSILGADARVPTSLITRVLNMLVVENGIPRTPLLLRRTALHTWDALSKSLRRSAYGNTVSAFVEHIKVLRDYVPKLLVDFARPAFEYSPLEEESDNEVELIKEEYLVPEYSQVLSDLLKKRHRRMEIIDRHTLGRLLNLIYEICSALEPSDEEEERFLDVTISLQEVLAKSIADLLMSSLIDVSYHEAVASGNGPSESNNLYEFGDINTQLKVVSDVLEELFESYWASIGLLPSSVATDTVRAAPIRAVLGWCVKRMAHSSPPKGMLKLLNVGVRGLQHQLNTPMYKLPAVPASPHEVTFIDIHRALIQWFPQSVHEEAFDLMDILNEAVAEDLMAKDLSQLIQGLGDQAEKFQNRTDASLELLASIVATSVPRRPDLAMSSLRALVDPSLRKQRIANGFPKSSRSSTGSFTRRMQITPSSPRVDPMSKSLYIHVILASCFDKFDALGVAAKQRGGPSYMGEKIDAFVEHAALSVRCLHACARADTHRDYVGAVLGDIFWTCLAMQDHGDGRVRLAGFEIFAASLDVLFHAQKAMVLVPSQSNNATNEATILSAGSVPSSVLAAPENANGITELTPHSEKDAMKLASASSADGPDGVTQVNGAHFHKRDSTTEDVENKIEAEDDESRLEKQMQTIFAEGGSCSFRMEGKSPSQLEFEERGWQMLCAFVSSSLGVGKYVDFVVQRACLEYLKGCMLNALRGRSTGASVITFEHVGLLWDSVNRLVGSPWRTLNALAMWVICAIVNVALYSSVMARGRGITRQRAAQLNEFLVSQVFPRAEGFLKNGIRETRIWGMRLLEAFLRARDQNSHVAQVVPMVPGRVLRGLDNLKHDWDDEVRERSQHLLEIHFSSQQKKSNVNSLAQQATNFMTLKRHQNDEDDNSASGAIELWFPPLPRPMKSSETEVYCRTLEAFANAEIEGGEETELVGAEADNEEHEMDYEGEFEDEEEGYDFEAGVGDQAEEETENDAEPEQSKSTVDVAQTESDSDPDGSDDFGGSEGSEDENVIDRIDSLSMADEEVVLPESVEVSKSESVDGQITEPVTVPPQVSNEDSDDHEFPPLHTKASDAQSAGQGPSVVTQVSDVDDEEFSVDAVPVRLGSSDDEEDVFDVTHEDDVLMDLTPVGKISKHSDTQLSGSSRRNDENKTRFEFSRPSSGRHGSMSHPSLKLNPDLDEAHQVPRRKGSFTSRPSTALHIEEGEAPRLARRRSHDVGSLTTSIDAASENKSGSYDVEDGALGSSGGRLMRRRSMKSVILSPKPADKGNPASTRPVGSRSEVNESDSFKDDVGEGNSNDGSSGSTSRLSRRRSMKSVALQQDEGALKSPEGAREGNEKQRPNEDVFGEAFMNLSPRGSRTPRGIKLDDDSNEVFEARPKVQPTTKGSGEGGRSKSGSEGRSGGSRSNRRSLPRAPAFLKGGSLQRRMSGGLGSSSGGNVEDTKKTESGTGVTVAMVPMPNSGSSSSPSLGATSSRPKLPRGRSQVNKAPRPEGLKFDSDSANERRPDRSHRYSKREPLKLGFEVDSEELDKDIFGDFVDTGVDINDEIDSQMRVGTPTAEALRGRNTLADDGPNSGHGRRRGSRRSVFNSPHYKGLLDQMDGNSSDDSPRSGGARGLGFKSSGSSRDGDKTSPGSSSRHEGLDKFDDAVDRVVKADTDLKKKSAKSAE